MTMCKEYTMAVNGVVLHYLAKGNPEGEVVLLLHGNGGSHNDLDVLTDRLAETGYCVFAIDSRGQGANEPLAEYHYTDMVEDIHQFIDNLPSLFLSYDRVQVVGKPFVFGWSDGGIVALMTEMKYPGTFAAIATSGVNLYPSGFIGVDDIAVMQDDIDTAPPLLKMCFTEPDIRPEELERIHCPVLVIAGENDIVKEEHTHLIVNHLPYSRLLILEGEDHDSHIKHSGKINSLLIDFFHLNTRATVVSIL